MVGIILFSLLCYSLLSGVFAADWWYVTSLYLNVRSEGRYESPIIGSLARGEKVTILSSLENGWRQVVSENGTVGYVNGRYLSAREPIGSIGRGDVYTVSVANVFVRGDTLKIKIAVLKKNDTLEALDTEVHQGKWMRVKIMSSDSGRYDHRIGYISKDFVRAQKSADNAVSTINGDWIVDTDIVSMASDTGVNMRVE